MEDESSTLRSRPQWFMCVSLLSGSTVGTTCRTVRSSERSWRRGEVYGRTPASAAGSPRRNRRTSGTDLSSDGSVENTWTDVNSSPLLRYFQRNFTSFHPSSRLQTEQSVNNGPSGFNHCSWQTVQYSGDVIFNICIIFFNHLWYF